MSDLMVVRLLRNPQGEEAPAGHRGDIVRVPDGRASLYLFPWEFEVADEARLRWLLRSPEGHPGEMWRQHRQDRRFARTTAMSCTPGLAVELIPLARQ